MHASPTIAGVCGSLREESTTRTALRHVLSAADDAGGDPVLLDLRQYDLPVYDGDNPATGDAPAFRTQIRDADAVVLATPVYHASIASPLKAALDYCRRDDLDGTTVGLLCTTGGSYYGPAFSHLRAIAQILNAWTIPHQVTIPHASDTIEDGTIQDADLRERAARLGEALVAYATIDEHPETVAEPALSIGD